MLFGKTLQNQVMQNPRVGRELHGHGRASPEELELRASAFSPSKFATSVWEKLNEGKFHGFNGREMKQLIRWNFLARLERNPRTPIS